MRITLSLVLSICCVLYACAGAVHELAKQGDAAKVKALIEADPGLLKATDPNSFDGTPLHAAAAAGKADALKLSRHPWDT